MILTFEVELYLLPFKSVPGTGDTKEEDKGMTMDEKKEAEKQRWWFWIMLKIVILKLRIM
jgi:hypothetical protein